MSLTGDNITTTSSQDKVSYDSGSGTSDGDLGSIVIIKQDKDDATMLLAGATFNIINSDNVIVGQVVTRASGHATYSGLALGDYTLVEVTAPDGYILDATSIPFSITDDQEKTLIVTNGKMIQPRASTDNNSTTENNSQANTSAPSLPVTGLQNGPLLISGLIACISAFTFLVKRK